MNNILKYIGNISQIGGVRPYELSDGWARKMRAIDINTGSGLHYTILPDRGWTSPWQILKEITWFI